MTAQEWEAAAKFGWREFYPLVEAEAKVYLTKHDIASTSTTELVEGLWPSVWQSGGKARQRVFKALAALETRALARWVTIAEPVRGRFGNPIRYRRWHTPQENGTEGQDRDNYSDDQDRDNYTVSIDPD